MNFKKMAENIKSGLLTLDDNLKNEFENFRAQMNKDLEALSVTISNSKPKMEVAPVMKWGQSHTEVHIFLKLSHRFDSPGCLELTVEPDLALNGNTLNFRAECVQASYPLIFVLEFELLKNVRELKFEKMSIGNYRIVAVKQDAIIWDDLFKNYDDRSKFTVKIWYELEDRYPEAMEMFYDKMERYFKTKKDEKKKKASKVLAESCSGHVKHFANEIQELIKVRFCPVSK